MPAKSEEDSTVKPKELVFLLAIAGRIDAQSKLLAQKLDNERYVYHAYAILDSLSSSYSMFKYFIEVFMSSTDPDYLHQILTSPEGIAGITAEALFLVSFSLLASLYDTEKENELKKFIATAWPFFRDVMKGLKNAYKGWRSAVQIMSMISGADLKYMIVPVGLVLGVFAAANRFWLRDMIERRKKQMDTNKDLLLDIQNEVSLTPQIRDEYLSQIEYQNEKERVHAFLAVGVGGLIDGLYLYIGVATLAVLPPPVFLAMAIISVIYTVACVISRVYEEYDYQLRLEITQTKCKFALVTKEMEITHARLLFLQGKKGKNALELSEMDHLRRDLCDLIDRFETLRTLLKEQTTHSYLTAGLLGMKYGLFAYGVLTSCLFMVATVFLVTATAFPPILLVACIVSGLVGMIGITAYMLRAHYLHLQKEKKVEEQPYEKLKAMKRTLAQMPEAEVLPAESFSESLKAGVFLDPSPQFFFQEWFEVLRSLLSGLSKGNNFSNFATTPLQDIDLQGHYHDSPVMGMLAMASALLFSVVLALRALARGLGRSLQQANPVANTGIGVEEPSMGKKKPEAPRESSERAKRKVPDSLPRNHSFITPHSFFQPPPKDSPKLIHSKSDNSLHQLANEFTHSGTTVGLE